MLQVNVNIFKKRTLNGGVNELTVLHYCLLQGVKRPREIIPLENKHYKRKLRHQLFGTERGFIELRSPQKEREKLKINNNNLSALQREGWVGTKY